MDQFIQHWNNTETALMEYFKKQYQSRPGEPKAKLLLHASFNIEKWAKCHRHFPHADTDTNMYLRGNVHSSIVYKTQYTLLLI